MGHALLPHPAGENDAVVGEVSGESPKPGSEAAGATTNNNKGGVGKVGEHIRPESHELILAFTGHQTGNTHHIVPTNPPTQLGAHSLTLGAAALDIVTLPSTMVEAVIALSIAYVAFENLYPRYAVSRRWAVSFLFGLVHGFGFSSVLKEIGLPKDSLLLSLLTGLALAAPWRRD